MPPQHQPHQDNPPSEPQSRVPTGGKETNLPAEMAALALDQMGIKVVFDNLGPSANQAEPQATPTQNTEGAAETTSPSPAANTQPPNVHPPSGLTQIAQSRGPQPSQQRTYYPQNKPEAKAGANQPDTAPFNQQPRSPVSQPKAQRPPTVYPNQPPAADNQTAHQPKPQPTPKPAPAPTNQPQPASTTSKFGSFQMPSQANNQSSQPSSQPHNQEQNSNWPQNLQPAFAGQGATGEATATSQAATRPTPDNLWDMVKQFAQDFFSPHDTPHLPSKAKPIATALAAGAVIFLLFNSQVILGQIQYLTNTGSSPATPAATPPGNEVGVSSEPKIIIPKINVNAPVVYDVKSFKESAVQKALERGVVHYGTTAVPGEVGNNVIVGHSSNNWWASGKYKFAFVLLDKLEKGDTFVLHYQSQKYIYEVFDKKIVQPTDTSVLKQTDRPITTLITCTPPGTSWQRLVVQAKQISPDPSQNQSRPQETATSEQVRQLAGDSDSFFDRIKEWLFPEDNFSAGN